MMKAIRESSIRINTTSIKQSYTNGDDVGELQGLFGQLKWWTLPKPQQQPKNNGQKKKGILAQFFDAAKDIYNYDPADELKGED